MHSSTNNVEEKGTRRQVVTGGLLSPALSLEMKGRISVGRFCLDKKNV